MRNLSPVPSADEASDSDCNEVAGEDEAIDAVDVMVDWDWSAGSICWSVATVIAFTFWLILFGLREMCLLARHSSALRAVHTVHKRLFHWFSLLLSKHVLPTQSTHAWMDDTHKHIKVVPGWIINETGYVIMLMHEYFKCSRTSRVDDSLRAQDQVNGAGWLTVLFPLQLKWQVSLVTLVSYCMHTDLAYAKQTLRNAATNIT